MMSRSWNKYSLGELAEYINGRAFKPNDWGNQGLPIIRIQNLTDSNKPFNYYDGMVQDRHLVNEGDLLISWSATLGSFIWDRGPSVLNQHIFKVLPIETLVNKEFLHFLVLNTLEKMNDNAHGIAMKHITKKKFETLSVMIPSLSEQHRIVVRIKECMERADELENLRAQRSKDLASLKLSLLFEDSPADVQWMPVGRLVEWVQSSETVDPQVAYNFAGMRSFGRGPFYSRTMLGKEFSYATVRRLQNGDFIYPKLMAWEGAFGMISETLSNHVVSPEFGVFRSKTEMFRMEVLDTYFRSTLCLSDVRGASTGSNKRRRRLHPREFLKLKVPVPSKEHQEMLVAACKLERQCADTDAETTSEIDAFRATILHKAFAGEL